MGIARDENLIVKGLYILLAEEALDYYNTAIAGTRMPYREMVRLLQERFKTVKRERANLVT